MKKSVWQAVLLSGVVVLSACAKKTEEAPAVPVEEQEVPMSAKPAEPAVVPQTESAQIDEMAPEASAHGEEDMQIVEVVEIDESANTATQDAEIQEGK